jgi:HD-GYP domain-containing protein (c-di-GMP phosphodiesterase class II)
MSFTALSNVRQRMTVGQALPFNVRDRDRSLLLARGCVIDSEAQLQALLERGALVDLEELQSARERLRRAPREQLPRLWHEGLSRIGTMLMRPHAESFTVALDDASDVVLGLVERDPDLAIFQVLTRDANADLAYGAQRALHTAICSHLVAQRLGWEPATLERVFKVALTMNLSMLELQGELARCRGAPTTQQRAELMTHPMRSVELLMQAGVDDDDWLQAVARHHEQEDGSGYPSGRSDVGEIASLVRRADVYTAKLASRAHREALLADQAGRQMFMQDPGHPMTAALVKEFGIYPPGCTVRLEGGELAIVVARGPSLTTPAVACFTNAAGAPLATPRRLDTSLPRHAVKAVVGERGGGRRPSLEKLLSSPS